MLMCDILISVGIIAFSNANLVFFWQRPSSTIVNFAFSRLVNKVHFYAGFLPTFLSKFCT